MNIKISSISLVFLMASCASPRTEVLREYYRADHPRPGVRLRDASFRYMQKAPIQRMHKSDVNVWIGVKEVLQVGTTPVALPDLPSVILKLNSKSRVFLWADRSCSEERFKKIAGEFKSRGFNKLYRVWVVGEPRYLAEEITTLHLEPISGSQ